MTKHYGQKACETQVRDNSTTKWRHNIRKFSKRSWQGSDFVNVEGSDKRAHALDTPNAYRNTDFFKKHFTSSVYLHQSSSSAVLSLVRCAERPFFEYVAVLALPAFDPLGRAPTMGLKALVLLLLARCTGWLDSWTSLLSSSAVFSFSALLLFFWFSPALSNN